MPNGRPGDHPLTDIVVHKIATFGAEIDDKIRRIQADASPELESLSPRWCLRGRSRTTTP
jgi:hypothetical protein